jgi:uncharacterized protein (TIGR00297 family)
LRNNISNINSRHGIFRLLFGIDYKWIIESTFVIVGLISGIYYFFSKKLEKGKNRFLNKFKINVDDYFEKSEVRDHYQVLANRGLGAILVTNNQIFPPELLYPIYISSLAAVCADTWATEIGTLRKTTTINILNLKIVDQGKSGGISIIGMFGAILGAFIIPISSLSWISKNFIDFIFVVTISGVLGSIIDSILGASAQAQFKCKVCGKIIERKNHCDQQSIYYKRLIWFDNDLVNFITSIAWGMFFIPLKGLFKV